MLTFSRVLPYPSCLVHQKNVAYLEPRGNALPISPFALVLCGWSYLPSFI